MHNILDDPKVHKKQQGFLQSLRTWKTVPLIFVLHILVQVLILKFIARHLPR